MGGALAHLLFEDLVLVRESRVKESRLQEIPDSEQDFGHVERLGEEVLGTHRKCFALGFRRDFRGEHEDGKVTALRDVESEFLEDRVAVKVRHAQVQQDEVRMKTLV